MKRQSLPSTSTQKLLRFLVPALVIVQIMAFVFLHFANRRIALGSVDAALEAGAQTFAYTSATRREYRKLTSELISKDYGLLNTISNENRATVESALFNQLARTGAELIVLADLDNRLLARSADTPLLSLPDEDFDRQLELLIAALQDQGRNLRPMSTGEPTPALHSWVKVTIRAPMPMAHIYLAYRVNHASVEQFTRMTQLPMAFVSHNDDENYTIHASTLPEGILAGNIQHYEKAADSFSVTAPDGSQHRVKMIDLGGMPGHKVSAVVAKPFAPVLSPFLRLEIMFAASIAFSALISIWAARHITNRVVAPLENVAQRDALTGLANRRLFEVNLHNAEENQKALNSGFAIMLMDLNKFKHVNDTYGHEAGDTVLKEVAARVRQLMRASDTLARLGGDEFAVLMRTDDAAKVKDAAAAIAETVRQPILLRPGLSVEVGASIGIAFSPGHSVVAAEVMHHADLAMYAAKKQGGGFHVADHAPQPA